MAALLLNLKQPYCIYIYAYLWLVTLAVVNAAAILQPKPDEIGTLNEETVRTPRGTLGVSPWDKSSVMEDLDSRPQAHTDLKFGSSDTFSSKFSLLNVKGSLKTSYLGGLVEVGGSAMYLRNTRSSNQQFRVTMYYSETTRFEQLTMSLLRKITYPEVFEMKNATHVVTAVLYGAQAFMVFDHTFSEDENKQTIEKELSALVNKIPKLSAEVNAYSKMTYAEKIMAEKISCTFHGDFRIERNPTTYMEALNLYKRLPVLLKDNPQNAVPIKVWLHPLHSLNSTAARLEREISKSLAFTTENIIERLEEAERTCNDLLGHSLVNSFKDINERLSLFHESLSVYKARLLNAIGRVLPAIRGGEKEEKSLEDILKIHTSSLFNIDKLNQWLNDAKSELDILSSVTMSLEGTEIVGSDNLNTVLANPDYVGVLCLTFTSLKYKDPYLSALKEFLNIDRFKEPYDELNTVTVASSEKWFKNSDLIELSKSNAHVFKHLSGPYQSIKVHGIISDVFDPSNPGASIYMYFQGEITKNPPHLDPGARQHRSPFHRGFDGGRTMHFRFPRATASGSHWRTPFVRAARTLRHREATRQQGLSDSMSLRPPGFRHQCNKFQSWEGRRREPEDVQTFNKVI
ncbi:Neoverrucotoxin subunit beta [Triplophysa tibetana]|uniref:Neoverrucotoxin subunit beta n=1 Tax=Triplophysa tibetana TaxID=1572043 RepID=A0A5A9NJ54_9TELE|nr:Neoverrucotoxin subunit beta [Triplophysa tibetana]